MTTKKLLLLAILAVSATLAVFFLRSRIFTEKPALTEAPVGMFLSPQKDKAISFAGDQGVWLLSVPENRRRSLGRLNSGNGARNVAWSSDGRLVAFESYSLAGHSPMTTTRVWVANPDTGALKEIRLPQPNERFSTYLDRWVSNDTLRIRSTLLEHPEDVFYLYRNSTGQIEGPVSPLTVRSEAR